MDYQDFLNAVQLHLADSFYGDGIVTIQQVLRNNNLKADAVFVRYKDRIISPVIYLNEYFKEYRKGKTVEEITKEVLEILHGVEGKFDWDLDVFFEFDRGRDHVVYRLINYERNTELLQTVPYRRFMNLAIIYCLIIRDSSGEGIGSILISQEHCRIWKTGEEELYRLAVVNTPKLLPARFTGMSHLMELLLKKDYEGEVPLTSILKQEPEWNSRMYLLTNTVHYFGASAILYPELLQEIFEKIKTDFYVIPCSVHELLIIPGQQICLETQLQEMIREVNTVLVEDKEYLSDSLYFYLGSERKLNFK